MKCLSCGKQFDCEKYYGICPKCGTYNKPATTQTSEEQVTFDSYQTADANMQTQTTQEQTTYGSAQSPCQEETIDGVFCLIGSVGDWNCADCNAEHWLWISGTVHGKFRLLAGGFG